MKKVPICVKVPENLVSVFRDILRQILEGSRSTTIPSDDLLQYDCAYAGRLHDEEAFGITYFPNDSVEGDSDPHFPSWEIVLDQDELSRIVNDPSAKLALWRCDSDCGALGPSPEFYCSKCDRKWKVI